MTKHIKNKTERLAFTKDLFMKHAFLFKTAIKYFGKKVRAIINIPISIKYTP